MLFPKPLLEVGREHSPNFTRVHNNDPILIQEKNKIMILTPVGNNMEEFGVFIHLFKLLNMGSLLPIHLLLHMDLLQFIV